MILKLNHLFKNIGHAECPMEVIVVAEGLRYQVASGDDVDLSYLAEMLRDAANEIEAGIDA